MADLEGASKAWEVAIAFGGVILGTLLSVMVSRYSEAMRDQRAERERLEAYLANLEVLASTVNRNLAFMGDIHSQVKEIADVRDKGISVGWDLRVTARLHYSPLSDMIRQLVSCGASHKARSAAMMVLQKMEVLDAQLDLLKEHLNRETIPLAGRGNPFTRVLNGLQQDTDPNSKFYNSIVGHYHEVCEIMEEVRKTVNDFEGNRQLHSFIFRP